MFSLSAGSESDDRFPSDYNRLWVRNYEQQQVISKAVRYNEVSKNRQE